MKKQLTKSASFTDIHWGAKANSEMHNQDCLNFIDWFCEQVRADPTIDHINFLGDWYENRSAINISTLNYAYRGAKKINALGLPVFFIVGNHDLYQRHTRDIYSTDSYHEFSNFTVINEPVVIPNIGDGALYSPFLFGEEYPGLTKFLSLKTWWGHFEFKGFIITGYNKVMEVGPDSSDFAGPEYIFSGHFHKRQVGNNVCYIGNAFPFTFNDAGDNDRGMMIYDHETNTAMFENWDDCPLYIKASLSDILDEKIILYPNARVKCLVDVPINFEESTMIKQKYFKDFNLREFSLEESQETQTVLTDTGSKVDFKNMQLASVDELVIHMLDNIESDKINKKTLIEIYKSL